MNAALVILAAGTSSRFGRPKQLEPVGPAGETLMDYCVYDAVLAGFSRVVLIVSAGIQEAMTAHAERWRRNLDVRIILQTPPPAGRTIPLGTAHALLCARDCVPGEFAVMNADDYYGPDAFYRLASALTGRAVRGTDSGSKEAPGPTDDPAPANDTVAGWLVGYRLGETLSDNGPVTRAICTVAADGTLAAVREAFGVERSRSIRGRIDGVNMEFSGSEVTSTNLWGFGNGVFRLLEESVRAFTERAPRPDEELRIADAVMDWITTGAADVTVLPTTGEWFGMTYEADVPDVKSAIADLVQLHAYPASLTSLGVETKLP